MLVTLSGNLAIPAGKPPLFLLLVIPPFLVVLMLFFTSRGRNYLDGVSAAGLTWLHTVRIGVELFFLVLFLHGFMPKIMAFEGRNSLFSDLGLNNPISRYFTRRFAGCRD